MITAILYPSDYDCIWFAIDSTGALAAFITGGQGAIPVAALQSQRFFEHEATILSLAETSTYTMIRTVPTPDSFIQLASRGLYVFDAELCNDFQTPPTPRSYLLMTKPDQPRKADSLPSTLRSRVELQQLDDCVFAAALRFEIPQNVHCISA